MFTFGNLNIDSNIVLAPIAGYMDSPCRRLCRRFGAGLVVTELISAEGLVRRNTKTVEMCSFNEEERPIGIQIFGKDPELLARAALMAEEMKPDFIDINMGCPANKVVNEGKGSGSALLLDPKLVHDVAASVVKAVSLPVTVKIRTGWDDSHMTWPEVVPALEEAGVALIAVHGRTRAQKYTGFADWNIIGKIAQMTSLPVIGNGDIESYKDALIKKKDYGCDAVMIGRAAFGNPWIFSDMEPDFNEIIDVIKLHLDYMIEEFGERGIIIMRKHMAKYIKSFRNAKDVRASLVTLTDREEIHSVLDAIEH
jgi:tRNA-dihydrouridine synthase B